MKLSAGSVRGVATRRYRQRHRPWQSPPGIAGTNPGDRQSPATPFHPIGQGYSFLDLPRLDMLLRPWLILRDELGVKKRKKGKGEKWKETQ